MSTGTAIDPTIEDRTERITGLMCLAGLASIAYRPLWLARSQADPSGLETWLFLPGEPLAMPAVALSCWLLWRRRTRLASLPRVGAPALAACLAAPGLALFVWGWWFAAPDLLLASLSLHLLAGAAGLRGTDGVRSALAPALALWLGLRLPEPIESELVWQLQLWTARDAAWLVGMLGERVSMAGILLWAGDVSFQVIEGCSGYQGLRILLLVTVVVVELLRPPARAALALFAAVPAIAYALNVVRVAAVVAGAGSLGANGVGEGHVLQGLLVLLVGTSILYGLGWGMRLRTSRAVGPTPGRSRDSLRPSLRRGELARAVVAMGSLCVLSYALAWGGRASIVDSARMQPPFLSMERAGWRGEALSPSGPDAFYFGSLPWSHVVLRRYRQEGAGQRRVDVFVVPDLPRHAATGRFFSARARVPGAQWSVNESWSRRVAPLDLVAHAARFSNGVDAQSWLVNSWRIRDRGLARESLRAWLGLKVGLLERERPRVVVRLTTPIPDEEKGGAAHAQRVLDEFVSSFRAELSAL